jgi:hypothetical protein
VADVRLADGTIALAHAPCMELGGLCVAGASLLLRRNAANGGTKTAFSIQLVAADEPECGACRPTWVGALPLLGNRLVAAALARGLLAPALGAHDAVRAEAMHGHMRVDFQLTHTGSAAHTTTLLEVKNVVCADYVFGSAAPRPKRYELVYGVAGAPYTRAAVFPVGKRCVFVAWWRCQAWLCVVCSDNAHCASRVDPAWVRRCQKLEDGTKVASTRAIKHVKELVALSVPGVTKARAAATSPCASCAASCLPLACAD